MATTKRKSTARTAKAKTKTKTKPKSRTKARVKTAKRKAAVPSIDVSVTDKATALEVKGERLLVKLSRSSHPEVFEIDRLLKQVQKVRESNKGKRKLRDLTEFLAETEKSLQIILSNHLEDALRKYLR